MPDWNPSLGAIYNGTDTSFRVWAPERARVDLVLGDVLRPLTRDDKGYWTGTFADAAPGALYRYRLDDRDDNVFPDPASRSQPHGVHGASMVVDPRAFRWTDQAWRAPALRDLILYELHVGTFTPEGTYRAVIARLPYLVRLGVTAIELMPLGDFPGDRNWGYDGVSIFAPARCYGSPDDLRALVDAAHAHGLAVVLDVVYNHLGPDGAYAHAFSPHYFTERHHTAWGAAVNLDGPHSREVRRFFIENALHWVREYHVDGLRLDATHALQDDGEPNFLAELTTTVRTHATRPVIVTAEDHRNLARMLRPVKDGGFGMDAVWADDFHHQVRVHTAGDREGYYADYTGTSEDLAATMRQGWFFTGQYSAHRKELRGTSAAGLGPRQFVICIQNHDQVGNRADGARLHHQVEAATYRAATTLLLLAPQTPLLFMGQEWATGSPFQFFTDHHEELGRLVTEGRRREFGAFEAFTGTATHPAVPDPQHAGTFERSRLDWDECPREPHAGMLALYTALLALRRRPQVRDATCASYDVLALDARTVAMTLRMADAPPADGAPATEALIVIVRFASGAVTFPLDPADAVETLLTTEDAAFAADAAPVRVESADTAEVSPPLPRSGLRLEFARPGAVVLRAACPSR
jgi:maltooligosyltrehalose trehalohydrolase